MTRVEESKARDFLTAASVLGWSKIHQKRQTSRKNAYDGLKMCITCKQKCDQNVCELWFI